MGRSNSATAAAAAAAFHLPYAMNAAAAYGMLPMFGVPPLGGMGYGGVGMGVTLPMGTHHHPHPNSTMNASHSLNPPPPPPSMPKVASMPAIVHHGSMSPPADRTVEPAAGGGGGGIRVGQNTGKKRKTDEDGQEIVKRVTINEEGPECAEDVKEEEHTGHIGNGNGEEMMEMAGRLVEREEHQEATARHALD